jgi:leucyl aminopeptidase (aminopeptidase T)
MSDTLMDRVADKVLRDSLGVRAGENVTIETWNTGLAFAERTVLGARRIGAAPTLLFEDEATFVESVRSTPPKFLGAMGDHERALLSRTDAYIFVPGPVLAGSPILSREELTSSTAYNPSWYEAANKAKLRGVRMLFGYVGTNGARILHRPLDRIVRHQLAACLADFQKVRRTGLALSRLLGPRSKVVVRAEEEELSFELGSEDALDDGVVDRRDLAAGGNMVNMPPGYYAREILRTSLTGAVRLHAPVPRIGRIADLRFEFDRGRLTKWECETDQRWLNELVKSTPKDRRTFGAVALGLNPELRRGFGQDRLTEGAVTFFGIYQGTARAASLDASGIPVVSKGKLV